LWGDCWGRVVDGGNRVDGLHIHKGNRMMKPRAIGLNGMGWRCNWFKWYRMEWQGEIEGAT
jgi:hypothetical protein